jgi:erythromycin esterase
MESDTRSKDKGSWPITSSKDLDPLMDRIGDARLVLLGEASHGTHDYYTWRSAISKRLIEEKGFNFIAVEGDWPDCYRVNRYVKGYEDNEKHAQEVLRAFNRWPTWMWANWEIVALVNWLKDKNKTKAANKRTGFYGLDVYSLWESLDTLISYLKKTDPTAAGIAEKALACFSRHGHDEQQYAVNALSASCKKEVATLLKEMRVRASQYNQDPEAALNTTQNAAIVAEAEKYYRNMLSFEEKTWNIRDRHMMDTLNNLLAFHGPLSKAIVWEHNTHVGDARYTDMAASGMFNIGQLAREQFPGSEAVIVGFSGYKGTVMAGSAWGATMQVMDVPEAKTESIEAYLNCKFERNQLLIFDQTGTDEKFNEPIPHRAIGVVYNPSQEIYNYVPSIMNKRYDALLFFSDTNALHPLHNLTDIGQMPETYPFSF